jgi:hypothetical protein
VRECGGWIGRRSAAGWLGAGSARVSPAPCAPHLPRKSGRGSEKGRGCCLGQVVSKWSCCTAAAGTTRARPPAQTPPLAVRRGPFLAAGCGAQGGARTEHIWRGCTTRRPVAARARNAAPAPPASVCFSLAFVTSRLRYTRLVHVRTTLQWGSGGGGPPGLWKRASSRWRSPHSAPQYGWHAGASSA